MAERARQLAGVRPGGVLDRLRDALNVLGEFDHEDEMYRAHLVLALTTLGRAVDQLYDDLGAS